MRSMICRVIAASLVLGAMVVLVPAGLRAQAPGPDDVSNSKHNMSTRSGLTNYGEVCVYCHTPHGGQTQNAPLWNRNFGTGPYSMYDASYSSTIDMAVAASPQGVSLACLSCHDGSIGLDVIINRPNADTSLAGSGNTMPVNAGQFFANLGTDLRNDHPISVTYDNVADPAFNAPVSGKIGGSLPLYTGRVECGTCHNPHNTSFTPFLRLSNSNSSLCKTCHIK